MDAVSRGVGPRCDHKDGANTKIAAGTVRMAAIAIAPRTRYAFVVRTCRPSRYGAINLSSRLDHTRIGDSSSSSGPSRMAGHTRLRFGPRHTTPTEPDSHRDPLLPGGARLDIVICRRDLH